MSTSHESLFRGTFEQAAVGIAHINLNGVFETVNQKLCEIVGYRQDELTNNSLTNITHKDDIQKDVELARQIIAGDIDTYSVEKRALHKSGSIIWINLTVSLARGLNGVPLYFIAVAKDITQQKANQLEVLKVNLALEKRVEDRTRELEHAKTQLDRFFNTSPDLFAIADMEGCFRVVNESFVRTTGFSREELTSQPYINFVHPDDRQITAGVASELIDKRPILQFENRYISKSGQVRWFSWRALPVPEEGVIYAAARDVTELKQQEMVIEAQRTQMIEAARLNSLGQMAAGIAHEINNPLSVLYLSTLRLREIQTESGLANEEVSTVIKRMEEMTWRMTSIIKGLKTFGRNGAQDPFEAVNVKELLQTSLELVEGYFKQMGVELMVSPVDSGIHFSGRAVQLSQVLVNLFTNAADSVHKLNEPWVKVEVKANSTSVELNVIDSGEKIPEKIIHRIFEPFFTTKPVGKGTGLGLSISIGIIQEHGGELYYDRSSPTAAFVIKLPLLQSS